MMQTSLTSTNYVSARYIPYVQSIKAKVKNELVLVWDFIFH